MKIYRFLFILNDDVCKDYNVFLVRTKNEFTKKDAINELVNNTKLIESDFSDSYQGEYDFDEVEFLTMVSFYNFLCE